MLAIVAAIVIIGLRLSEFGFTPLLDLVGLFEDRMLGRLLVPLLLGILGFRILLLSRPLGARGTAELTRRSILKTGTWPSFAIIAATLASIIILSFWDARADERVSL